MKWTRTEHRCTMKLDRKIDNRDCLWFLGEHAIEKKLAAEYLHQAEIKDTVTGRTKRGLAFENDRHGYHFMVPKPDKHEIIEGIVGPRGNKTYKARPDAKDVTLYAFPHVMDFLAHIQVHLRNENIVYHIYETIGQEIIDLNPTKVYHAFRTVEQMVAMGDLLEPVGIDYRTLERSYPDYPSLSARRAKNSISVKRSPTVSTAPFIGLKPQL